MYIPGIIFNKDYTRRELWHAKQEKLKDYHIGIKDIAGNDIFIQCLSKEAAKVPDYRHPSYIKHNSARI